jgi:hypothetical protein
MLLHVAIWQGTDISAWVAWRCPAAREVSAEAICFGLLTQDYPQSTLEYIAGIGSFLSNLSQSSICLVGKCREAQVHAMSCCRAPLHLWLLQIRQNREDIRAGSTQQKAAQAAYEQ